MMDGDISLFLSRFFPNVCCVIEEKEKVAHVFQNWVSCKWIVSSAHSKTFRFMQ